MSIKSMQRSRKRGPLMERVRRKEIDDSYDTQGRWLQVLLLFPGRITATCAYL